MNKLLFGWHCCTDPQASNHVTNCSHLGRQIFWETEFMNSPFKRTPRSLKREANLNEKHERNLDRPKLHLRTPFQAFVLERESMDWFSEFVKKKSHTHTHQKNPPRKKAQIGLGSGFLVLSLRESNLSKKTTIPTSFYHTLRTHGTSIFSYIYHKENQPNVAKYTSPMDPMGYNMVTMMKLLKSQQLPQEAMGKIWAQAPRLWSWATNWEGKKWWESWGKTRETS